MILCFYWPSDRYRKSTLLRTLISEDKTASLHCALVSARSTAPFFPACFAWLQGGRIKERRQEHRARFVKAPRAFSGQAATARRRWGSRTTTGLMLGDRSRDPDQILVTDGKEGADSLPFRAAG